MATKNTKKKVQKKSTPAGGRSTRKIQQARGAAKPKAPPSVLVHKGRDELVRVDLTEKGLAATAPVVAPDVPETTVTVEVDSEDAMRTLRNAAIAAAVLLVGGIASAVALLS